MDSALSQPKTKVNRRMENLRKLVEKKRQKATTRRIAKNPISNQMERILGAFSEMLESQVKNAVLLLNKKGYSTDASGFMNSIDSQTIDGDFTLDEFVMVKLQKEGVKVETNPSGYTRLQFWPAKASMKIIKSKWDKIARLLPDRGKMSASSMTQRAREFRKNY